MADPLAAPLGKHPSQGTVYICENLNNRIQVLNHAWVHSRYIGGEKPKEGEEAMFSFPEALALNSDDQLFVVDGGNHRVSVLDHYYKTRHTIGKRGSGEGEFQWPRAILIDDKDNIYVTDSGNHRVQIFTPKLHFMVAVGGLGTGTIVAGLTYLA
jgi:DNA-binding beta-propeller fold protein YncE